MEMKNAISWDVATCGSFKNRRFRGTEPFHHLYYVFLRSVHRLLVTANVVPSSPILVTLMMEALPSSKTLVLTKATRPNIPEDGILDSHCSENLKTYTILTP
jgi:hypothetical protein